MPVVLEAAGELAAILAVLVVLGLAVLLDIIVKVIVDHLLGWLVHVPFVGASWKTMRNALVHAADSFVAASEGALVTLWNGLLWSISETIDSVEYVAKKYVQALEYLYAHAIPALVGVAVKPIASAERKLATRVKALERAAGHAGGVSLAAAKALVHASYAEAIRYVHGRETAIRTDIQTATATVETDITATLHAIGEAVTADLPRYGGLALDELEKLWGEVDWTKVAEYGGAFALLYSLIRALEAETGLGNRECREKVKQICQTDPRAWESLLAGLATLGLAFNLRELVELAHPVIRELRPVIEQVAG